MLADLFTKYGFTEAYEVVKALEVVHASGRFRYEVMRDLKRQDFTVRCHGWVNDKGWVPHKVPTVHEDDADRALEKALLLQYEFWGTR